MASGINRFFFTMTPISPNPKKNSRIDYEEQKEKNALIIDGNMFWCWDDAKGNPSKKGDLFAFYHNKGIAKYKQNCKITFHKIIDIKSAKSHRPSSWSKNVGQGDRNVLELSPPLEVFSLEEWASMNGPHPTGLLHGTKRLPCCKIDKPLLYKVLLRL